MIGIVYLYDDLKAVSRLGKNAQLATVERWAKSIGLEYNYDGRGGIWTTAEAMNAAVGLKKNNNGDEPYTREMLVG